MRNLWFWDSISFGDRVPAWVIEVKKKKNHRFLPLGLPGRRGIVVACVCPSVCPSVRKLYLVRTITLHKFELESPNLHQTCILQYSRLILKWRSLTLTFKAIWPFRLTKRHSTSLLYTDLGRSRGATRPKCALVDNGNPVKYRYMILLFIENISARKHYNLYCSFQALSIYKGLNSNPSAVTLEAITDGKHAEETHAPETGMDSTPMAREHWWYD